MKMYIAVLDEFPDYMTPTLVAHAVLGHHRATCERGNLSYVDLYYEWLYESFKKCVVRVNRKEFERIRALDNVYESSERSTLNGEISCLTLVVPNAESTPNVLKFAKLWSPRIDNA